MTGWLLDTNVLLELRQSRPEPKVVALVSSQPLDLPYVSTITLADIRFGIECVTDASKRNDLTN